MSISPKETQEVSKPDGVSSPSEAPEKPLEVKDSETTLSKEEPSVTTISKKESLAERLIKVLQPAKHGKVSPSSNSTGKANGIKRGRVRSFSEMMPLSLTIPYPEDYLQKRVKYAEQVNEREKAIIAWQEEKLSIDIAQERHEAMGKKYGGPSCPKVSIPPIPSPPEPPKLKELNGIDPGLFDDQHEPCYTPKNAVLDHLDRRCFHITEGRYFGLISNKISDPLFVGPNAPGIGGLNLTSTSVLATASTTGGSSSVPLLVAPAVPLTSRLSSTDHKVSRTIKKSSTGKDSQKKGSTKSNSVASKKKPSNSESPTKKKGKGPIANATASDLKKLMEEGGELAGKMRGVIIGAAVHAARAGKHDGRPFRALDDKVYPDICKAFSSHAGMKPCKQCRINKQGIYYCRLKRRHQDPDFDGGDSWKTLAPYFLLPMGDLVIKPKKKQSTEQKKPNEEVAKQHEEKQEKAE